MSFQMQINLFNRRSWQASPYLRLCPYHHLVREALSALSTVAASESRDSCIFYILQNAKHEGYYQELLSWKTHNLHVFTQSFPECSQTQTAYVDTHHCSFVSLWATNLENKLECSCKQILRGPPPLPVTLWSGSLCFLMTHPHYQ